MSFCGDLPVLLLPCRATTTNSDKRISVQMELRLSRHNTLSSPSCIKRCKYPSGTSNTSITASLQFITHSSFFKTKILHNAIQHHLPLCRRLPRGPGSRLCQDRLQLSNTERLRLRVQWRSPSKLIQISRLAMSYIPQVCASTRRIWDTTCGTRLRTALKQMVSSSA